MEKAPLESELFFFFLISVFPSIWNCQVSSLLSPMQLLTPIQLLVLHDLSVLNDLVSNSYPGLWCATLLPGFAVCELLLLSAYFLCVCVCCVFVFVNLGRVQNHAATTTSSIYMSCLVIIYLMILNCEFMINVNLPMEILETLVWGSVSL